MNKKALGFSITGSVIIILFMLFINFTTSPGFPWFIYPAFAALWWPLGVFAAQKGGARFMAIAGPLLSAAFFIAVNLTTSPGFLWCVFPIFGLLWWPLGYFLGRKIKIFSLISAVLVIGFFLLVNVMTGFGHPWFIYPAFGIIWWPLAVLVGRGRAKLFSLLGFLLIAGFFITVNLVTSPGDLWFIHTVFAAAWWPLSVFLARRRTIKVYSLMASLMTIAYLVVLNLVYSPGTLWCLYSVFPLVMWPAIMYMERQAASLPVAIAGSLTGIVYYLMLNIFMSPGHPWILYLALPLVWWPVAIMFRKIAANAGFLLAGMTVFIIYYGLLNIFISPGHPWSLYLIYPYAWAVIGMYYGRRKKAFALSIAATVITAAFVTVINFIYTPNTIWAIFPVFAIVWWPLSLYFFSVRSSKKKA